MKGVKPDLTGQRFGKLLVIGESPERKRGYTLWIVQCDCGSPVKTVITTNLIRLVRGTISCGCLLRSSPGVAARNRVLRNYKKNAKKRSHMWALSEDTFNLLTKSNCHYCGCTPSSVSYPDGSSNGAYTYNGIDRIDNQMGYVGGNVVSCCKRCNWAKGEQSHAEFMSWIATLFQHQAKNGLPTS